MINNIVMEKQNLTELHENVLTILEKEHLTSFQILSKLKNTTLILEVYDIIDDLKSNGLLKSYVKDNMKLYYVS